MHAIGLAVVDRDPVGIELGRGIGRARIERRGLASAALPAPCRRVRRSRPDRSASSSQARECGSPRAAAACRARRHWRCIPAVSKLTCDMALRGEIVDLVRLGLLDDADQVGRIGHVAIMEDEALVRLVRILVEMLDPAGVERRRAALDAVDDIALVEQQFGQIGAVLAGDAGDQGDLVRNVGGGMICQSSVLRGRSWRIGSAIWHPRSCSGPGIDGRGLSRWPGRIGLARHPKVAGRRPKSNDVLATTGPPSGQAIPPQVRWCCSGIGRWRGEDSTQTAPGSRLAPGLRSA